MELETKEKCIRSTCESQSLSIELILKTTHVFLMLLISLILILEKSFIQWSLSVIGNCFCSSRIGFYLCYEFARTANKTCQIRHNEVRVSSSVSKPQDSLNEKCHCLFGMLVPDD